MRALVGYKSLWPSKVHTLLLVPVSCELFRMLILALPDPHHEEVSTSWVIEGHEAPARSVVIKLLLKALHLQQPREQFCQEHSHKCFDQLLD